MRSTLAAELGVQPWDALLASPVRRPDSPAQAALRHIVGETGARWMLDETTTGTRHWRADGWPDEAGHHSRRVLVHFDEWGRIVSWSLARCGGWESLHDGPLGLSQVLRTGVLP